MATRTTDLGAASTALVDAPPEREAAAAPVPGPALEAYFSLSPDAMCIIGPDGILVAANAAAGQLFGTLPGNLIGRPHSALFAGDVVGADILAAGLTESAPWESLNSHFRVSIDGVTEDARLVPIDLSLIPLKEGLTELTLAVMRLSSESVPVVGDPSAATVAAAREMISIQRELLVEIAHGHGVRGIAQVLRRRTGRPVLILDPLGQVLAQAGYGTVAQIPEDHLVGGRSYAPHGVRERRNQSWIAAACPDRRLLGWISIFDPDDNLPEPALSALEHATAILAAELLRQAAVALDATISLSEFTQMLLDGLVPETGSPEAGMLGSDPEAPLLAVVVDTPADQENVIDLVSQAARSAGLKRPLVTSRDGRSVLLTPEEAKWEDFTSALHTSFGAPLHIGVGGFYKPGMLARSLDEAVLALKLGTSLDSETPVTKFCSLGVWEILVDSSQTTRLRQLVDKGIGALIQHDRLHNSQLVKTLTTYLKESCTADAATLLHVHRNTLRYRLSKIALITGCDLADPDQRFQLEFACRAWLVLQGLEDA